MCAGRSAAKRNAVARPMPRVPPVMNTTRSLSHMRRLQRAHVTRPRMRKQQMELCQQPLGLVRDVVVTLNKERSRSAERAAARSIEQDVFGSCYPFVYVMARDGHAS